MLEKLGRYRIDSVLGAGAMGMVYKAFDLNIERPVALKTIRAELFQEGQENGLFARFRNEAQASGRLQHPGIVAVYDFGEIDQVAYLAMEFVEGTPLSALLVAGTPTNLDVSITCMSQLLQALAYAHARGVVHRDIKPANLLITSESLVKITDFGIARIESSTLTQDGSLIGTPSYMSPEQLRGEVADGRSDVFAAGIVLYQLLTGSRPFHGSVTTVMHQILYEEPAKPTEKNADLGHEFNAVVEKALAKNPHDRYASAQHFLEALQAAHHSFKTRLGAGAQIFESTDCTFPTFQPPPLGASVEGDQAITSISRSSTSTHAVAPWLHEILPELQALLSAQVGPIAKILLKNAMKGAANVDGLCQNLLPHIQSEKGRLQFLDGVRRIGKKAGSGIHPAAASGKRADATASASSSATNNGMASVHEATQPSLQSGLSPALLEAAERALTSYIGPIAKVVTKRTAKQTVDRQEFLRQLAENISSSADRAKFLREIG